MTEEEKAYTLLVCAVAGFVGATMIKNAKRRRVYHKKVLLTTQKLNDVMKLFPTIQKRTFEDEIIDLQFMNIVENYYK